MLTLLNLEHLVELLEGFIGLLERLETIFFRLERLERAFIRLEGFLQPLEALQMILEESLLFLSSLESYY